MDGIIRILRRFVGTTFLLFAALLLLNFVLLGLIVFKEMNEEQSPKTIVQNVASSLSRKDTSYMLGEEAHKQLAEQNAAWAMLLDHDGNVQWEYQLPEEIPHSYTVAEAAKFSRYYLAGYPVFVWEHEDGLVVVGYPRQSYAKYQFYFMESWISTLPQRAFYLLIGNVAVALLLSLLIGARLIRSVKPLAGVVHALGKDEAVHVESKGLFRDLAQSINKTSGRLQEKNVALKVRNEARSNWINGISHDIRTPLSMILGYACELEDNGNIPPEQRKQAGIIRKQGEKLRALVHDLNLVSMLEYDMQPLHVKPIRLSAVARQVASDFLNNGMEDAFHITLHIADERIQVQADEKLLLRAVTNLVQNSIIHNPGGCAIELATCLSPDRPMCRFIVSDNGQGIPQKQLADVVELPYSSARTRSDPNGHGLGLPMVARIAQAHHGRLILNSDVGQGLQAIVELPVIAS